MAKSSNLVRCSGFFAAFLLLAFLTAGPALGQSGFVTFFGPVDFVRGTAKPVVEVKEFSALGFLPPFTLHMRNGDENGNSRVSSAEVWLNGNLLFGESDFSQMVSGHDVAVSLDSLNTLKVKLNSGPGSKLTIWIEGRPPVLNITLDEGHRVNALMTSSGGTLSTTTADGTTVVLTIPEGALYEEQQISMAPVVSITGLPFSGGFLRGVELEPDGLRFLKPSTLVITSPTPLNIQNKLAGFTYDSNGVNFHIFPVFANQTSLMFYLAHLSGYGTVYGTDPEIEATTTAVPRSDLEIWAEAEIAAAIAENIDEDGGIALRGIIRIKNALQYWFEQGILPALGEAILCAADLNCSTFSIQFQNVMSQWANWNWYTQLLGLDNDLLIQLMSQQFVSLVQTEFSVLLQDYMTLCGESIDFCGEQVELVNRYALVYDLCWRVGMDVTDYPEPGYFCPSWMEKAVLKIEIVSPAATVDVGKTISLNYKTIDGLNQPIQNLTDCTIMWQSSDPTKATVDKDNGVVTGVAAGSAKIMVTLTQCGFSQRFNEVSITVKEGPEISIEATIPGSGVIPNGGSFSFGLGPVRWGSYALFTIKNLGAGELTITTITITGGPFSLDAGPSHSVAPGGSTTFELVFQASEVGAEYSALLSIGNNDSDENPYNIVLTGIGFEPDPH